LETETLTPILEDVPATNLILIEESEVHADTETELAPDFTPIEFPTEKKVPKILKETDPDAGELNTEDDTTGTSYEQLRETDPVPMADTRRVSLLAEPRELRETTLESDDQTLDCDDENPITLLWLKLLQPKLDPEATTTT